MVGRLSTSGRQLISIGPGCQGMGVIAHEIGRLESAIPCTLCNFFSILSRREFVFLRIAYYYYCFCLVALSATRRKT